MVAVSTAIRRAVNRTRHLLFPPTCLFCHQPLDDDQQGCCAACLPELKIWPTTVCARCGRVLPDHAAPGPCGHCLRSPPAQVQTVSLYRYAGPVREAILAWKLQGDAVAARWLVQTAADVISTHLGAHDLLLPIPMPLARMRRSGQHHSADLCHWLAEISGASVNWQLLRRIGEQPRQSSLSGRQRRHNMCKAFHLAADHKAALRDRIRQHGDFTSLWVVDDILTTGATLHYAAKAARPLGLPVHVLSLARTPRKEEQ